jgi:DNA-binding transcriptional LysR family regulator
MEDGLGVLLVEHGQRLMGFTPEGEKVLEWAKHVIADDEGLQQSLSEMRRGLTGYMKGLSRLRCQSSCYLQQCLPSVIPIRSSAV